MAHNNNNWNSTGNPSSGASTVPGLLVKKEPEDIPSTSQHDIQPHIQMPPSSQPQTISVSVAPNQVTHTIVDGPTTANGQPAPHILTQHDPTDLQTAVQIAQVQGLPSGTHQLTLSNLNQVWLIKQLDIVLSSKYG